MRPAFLVLCGKPGVGKTTVRVHLAHLTNADAFGPDDYGNWIDVLDRLDRTDHAIVECCRLPRALRNKAAERGATVVELTAPRDTRAERLTQRGDAPEVIQRLLDEDDLGLAYEDQITPDMTLSTDGDAPEDIARTIALSTNPMG